MRRATLTPTSRPTQVEPVKDIRLTRVSLTNFSARSWSWAMKLRKIGGKPPASSASLQIFCTATPHSATFLEGFQTVTLPQMAAMKAFQAHTATGKLKAEMTPTTPSGCHCSYIRCSGRSECMVKP